VWVHAGHRPVPREKLATARPVDGGGGIGGVQRDTQSGARFVRDRVERQQGLAQPLVAAVGHLLERDLGSLANITPQLEH
jgi:hypothetical protein